MRVGYRGSASDLSVAQRRELEDWRGAPETVTVAEGREHIEAHYGVVSQSQHAYYELLEAGGRSYHRPERGKPQRDAAPGLTRREEIKKTWRRAGRRVSGES